MLVSTPCAAQNTDNTSHKGGAPAETVKNLRTPEEIIAATQPTRPGERNARVFDLARGLRRDAGLDGTPLRDVKPFVREWHTRARPVIVTQDFTETWSDFVHAWPRVNKPLSHNAVAEAWERVTAGEIPPEATEYDKQAVQLLVALCWHLSGNDGRFYLSTAEASKRIVTDRQTAWRYLNMIEADGLIETVKKGHRHTKGLRPAATTFRWNGAPQEQPTTADKRATA